MQEAQGESKMKECPYCGAEMKKVECAILTHECRYICPNCGYENQEK